ncbi:hypothetical protein CL620_03720 [archaeon]|nr:hypothetical protein [archaeon]
MARTIIFDFWGTLVENGIHSPINQVKEILGLRMRFSEYVVRMENAMMTKPYPSLQEAFEAVCSEFGVRYNEELVGMWNKSWMLAKPYNDTIRVLEELKQNHTLILVSNTDAVSINNVLDKFELRPYFSEIHLSCEMGMIKTDPGFMAKVLDGKHKNDCVFVGDSVLSDMKAAEQAGIRSILIDRRRMREYPEKIASLSELGGKL